MKAAAATTDTVYDAMEAASETDRLWFEAHPHRSFRVRPHIPGEWPPGSLPARPRGWRPYTVVRQVMPGFRLRLAFSAEGEPGQGERAAERLYEMMMRGGPP
jgi:hypothetical protein